MTTDQETYIEDNVQTLVELMRELEPYERCSQDWFRVLFRCGVVMEHVLDASGVAVLKQVLRNTSDTVGAENMVLTSTIQNALDAHDKHKRGRPKKNKINISNKNDLKKKQT